MTRLQNLEKIIKIMVLNAQKNLCVITVINSYVKLENLVSVHKLCFHNCQTYNCKELDPPIYRLNVDGERVELKAEELQEQRLFIRACMNQIHKFPPTIKTKRL